MSLEIQRFSFAAEVEATEPTKLVGYAVKWNVLSHDRGGYRAVFRPSSFQSLTHFDDKAGIDIKALFDHSENHYLGRTGNDTLKLFDDGIGVRFEMVLPDTQLGRDTAALVARKDLLGMSVGVVPGKWNWKEERDGLPIQEHITARLLEISTVFNPAIPNTSVGLAASRDFAQWKKAKQLARMKNLLALST